VGGMHHPALTYCLRYALLFTSCTDTCLLSQNTLQHGSNSSAVSLAFAVPSTPCIWSLPS
jgi:hypothetical protein